MNSGSLRRLLIPMIALFSLLSLVFIPSTSVSAATFNPGCNVAQLVADVASAGSNGQADTINLEGSCVYALTTTLTINADAGNLLTINGNGAALSGKNLVRVMSISSNANVILNAITITAGNASGDGGGINNAGTLTLSNSTVSENSSPSYGGGIASNGTLTLNSSTVSENSSSSYGGGIYNAGTLTLNNSTVSENSTYYGGGGIKISVFAVSTTLTNSTISDNIVSGANTGVGGGIAADSRMTLINSTVSGNTASGTGLGLGGGIHSPAINLTLYNSTVSGNTASPAGEGGGIYIYAGITALFNSIVANNASGGDCFRFGGSVAAAFSLIEDGTCGIVSGTDGNRTGDPNLGNLTGNPAYHPLNTGSIAINAGLNPLVPAGITTDQAGNARIQNGIVDMGSFERYVPPTNTPTFTPSPHPSLTPPAPDTNLITNGTFDAGLNGWSFINSTQQVNNGVLTIAPTSAGGGFTQQVNFNSAGGTYQVNFQAANTSATVKTVNLMVRDGDWSPLYNCVFVLPAFSPFQNYRMRVNTSPNAFIPMTVQFALSGDSTMGVLFDDITMVRRTNLLVSATECVTAPPASTNLVYDGAFNQGTANWAAFNATMNTANIGGANGNIMQIGRNTGTPSGGFYQFNPYSAPANGVLRFEFQMGNQSAQSRVINMLVRNTDWTDLHSCFITMPPNTPLTNFEMMLRTNQAWTNIVIQGWIQVGDYVSGTPPFMFDNISIQYLPTSGFAGSTQCPVVPPMPQRPTLTPSATHTLTATVTPSLTASPMATMTNTETALPSATATASETPTVEPTIEPPALTPIPTDTATPEPPTTTPELPTATAEPPTLAPTELPSNTPEPPPEVTQSP